jgi:hypothetical protein
MPTANACSNWWPSSTGSSCASAASSASPARHAARRWPGRLDRWLSVLDYVATAATGGGLFTGGLDFLLAVVKERTDPRTLPGVEAMMPGSALTRLLNATPELVTSADLSVIAGDIEAGDGLWNTLKVLATDWFYKNEHDLVVDTASMLGGLPRLGGAARYRQDQGRRSIISAISPTTRACAG